MTLLAMALAAALSGFQTPASNPKPKMGGAPVKATPDDSKKDDSKKRAAAEPQELDEAAVRALVGRYRETDLWTLKAIVLVALGPRWHPSASGIVYDALDNKDIRLQAYGLEAILRTDPSVVRCVATKEIVETLIRQVNAKNPFVRGKVFEALSRLVPAVKRDDAAALQKWWQGVKGTFEPEPWPGAASRPAQTLDSGTAAERFVTRAVDLNEAGLEVVVCMDSTGSMQPTIDAARIALRDILAMLGGITPKLRLGLVHYKDLPDMGGGARVLARLDEPAEKTQRRLESLTAGGGGDVPEAVDKGLELALDPKELGWTPTANKVVVIIGDAPPHDADMETTVKLAKQGFEKPFGKEISVYTDVKTKVKANRPFITSAIIVGKQPAAKRAFEAIADAGGGMCGALDAGGGGAESIVAHILTLSFGRRFEHEARTFVEIAQEYRKGGAWK